MPKKRASERTPKGLEVPVPKRREFIANLKEAAKPDKDPSGDGKPARRTGKK
jgi:hypothetical protein